MLDLFSKNSGVFTVMNNAAKEIRRIHVMVASLTSDYTVPFDQLSPARWEQVRTAHLKFTQTLQMLEQLGADDVADVLIGLAAPTSRYLNTVPYHVEAIEKADATFDRNAAEADCQKRSKAFQVQDEDDNEDDSEDEDEDDSED